MVNMQAIRKDALDRMPNKPYHNKNHTKRVVKEIKKHTNNKILIAAAYYHDVGHNNGSEQHEERSAKIAKEKLVEFGFSEKEAEKAKQAILDTKLHKTPETKLGAKLSDADTHNLSYNWTEFKNISLKVKQEIAPTKTEADWFTENALPLLEKHEYHSPWKSKYKSSKQKNIKQIKENY